MRLRSFGPWSPRLERLSDTPRDLVDHGGFLVEHSQLFVRQRRRCAALGLDVGDRLTHLARPPEPLAALETLLELFNANPDVKLRVLFDEEGGQDASRDRKSTRLNSSHLVISYAVFCLKKKRTINRRSIRVRI